MSDSEHSLYDRTDNSIYGSLHILTMQRPGAEAAEFLQTGVDAKQNPDGRFIDCAKVLFKIPASQWNGIDLFDQEIKFDQGNPLSHPVEFHHPSQLAFCFLNGINRIDDAYTLANYPRYLFFCRQNKMGLSCWSTYSYRAGLKVFDQDLEQSTPSREPGEWFIHHASKDRYYKGSLEQLIEALRQKELSYSVQNDALVYCSEASNKVTERYSIAEIQVLCTLAEGAKFDPGLMVAEWIREGIAPTLLALHQDDLKAELDNRGLDASIITSAYQSRVSEQQRAIDPILDGRQLIWPDLRKRDYTPTLDDLKQPHNWTVSLFVHELVRFDLRRFVEGEGPLKPLDLLEVLVKQAPALHLGLDQLYDSLPERLKRQTLPKQAWSQYRLELAEIALQDPSELVKDNLLGDYLHLSPEEWHVLVVKQQKMLALLPHEVICDWKFWHPMTDLAALREEIKPLVPEGFFLDPDFQRFALMTGLVEPSELGSELLGIAADDLNKVLRYPELTEAERGSYLYRTVGLGVVLHDPKQIGLIPESVLDSLMVYAAAYHDIGLLNQLPSEVLRKCPLMDDQLSLILHKQTASAEEVAHFAEALPAQYHTESTYRLLNDRMGLYGTSAALDKCVFLSRSAVSENRDVSRDRTVGMKL